MVQRWQVLSFTKREKLNTFNDPEEILHNGMLVRLVWLLAVPIPPQGLNRTQASDAGTVRLSRKDDPGRLESFQKSDNLSVEEQEENHTPTTSLSIKRKRGNSRVPTKKRQKIQKTTQDDLDVLPATWSASGLSRLPVELLDLIFHKLDLDTVFFLGFQTQHFWNVALRHIRALFLSPYGRWAGKGIICVGACSESTDNPPNMLTESDQEELQTGLSDGEPWDDVENPRVLIPTRPVNLYQIACARYQEVSESEGMLLRSQQQKSRNIGEWTKLSDSRKSQIFADVRRYRLSDFYPQDQPWILRNLTTHEFVRSEAIAIKPEYIRGPNIDVWGFGEVVWSRICWSTDPESLMPFTDTMHRGIWAGHRFDITTLDRHKQDSSRGAEWKDISEEVAHEIERFWSTKLGSAWRDELPEYKDRAFWGEFADWSSFSQLFGD